MEIQTFLHRNTVLTVANWSVSDPTNKECLQSDIAKKYIFRCFRFLNIFLPNWLMTQWGYSSKDRHRFLLQCARCGKQPGRKYYAKMTRQNVGNYPKYHQKIITHRQNSAVWHSPASGGCGGGKSSKTPTFLSNFWETLFLLCWHLCQSASLILHQDFQVIQFHKR